MLNFFKKFSQDDAGAVTVDWVVLTAAIVGLGVVILGTVGDGVNTVAGTIQSDLNSNTTPYTAD